MDLKKIVRENIYNLTPEYAEKIGADWYAKDAKQSADIAKKFFGES